MQRRALRALHEEATSDSEQAAHHSGEDERPTTEPGARADDAGSTEHAASPSGEDVAKGPRRCRAARHGLRQPVATTLAASASSNGWRMKSVSVFYRSLGRCLRSVRTSGEAGMKSVTRDTRDRWSL